MQLTGWKHPDRNIFDMNQTTNRAALRHGKPFPRRAGPWTSTRLGRCFGASVACLVWLIVTLCPHPSPGEEPAEKFLEALRENGYFDIALVYLESLENNPAISAEFRRVLPLERAETLIKSTALLRNIEEWEARLDEAQKLLGEAAQWNDSPDLQARALRYQGNLLYRRARVYLNRAKDDRLTDSEREPLVNRARELLDQSRQSYTAAQQVVADLIRNFRIDPDDPNSNSRLKQYRNTFTKIRIQQPLIDELLADTYPPGSEQQRELLTRAAAGYAELWDKYYRYAAGLDSCLFAARTHYKLGDYNRAISYVQEILSLSDSTAFRNLKRNALVLAADIWSKMDPYPVDEVIANFEPYVARLNRVEQRHPDWQRVQLELARALHAKAQQLKESDEGGNTGRINNLNRDAARLIKALSRMPGDLRDEAQKLLEQWNLSTTAVETDTSTIESFVDARQKGIDLVVEVESQLADVENLRRQLAQATSEEDKSRLQAELDDAVEELRALAGQALEVFDLALKLVDDGTVREDINNVRYLQAVCHFAIGNYFETAVIGEFLLEKYPNVNGTRQATGLVIKALAKLHDQIREQFQPYVRTKLEQISQRVLERWPGSKEAIDAASTLARLAMADSDLAAAGSYLKMIPEDSDARVQLAVRLGRAYWVQAKQAQAATDPGDGGNANNGAEALDKAYELLKQAIAKASPERLDYETALGALLLVDAMLEKGEVDQAIEQLESAPIAPLDLVKQKHPAIVQSSGADLFFRETYKIAVKAYLAGLNRHPEDATWLAKAQGVIQQMREEAEQSDDPQAEKRVIAIYQLIARELKNQFDAIGDLNQRKAFAANLAKFLDAIARQSNDPRTILWAGATLMSVADTLASQATPDDARPLYVQAIQSFDRVEKIGLKDPALIIELVRQRAIAKRGLGQYEEAMQDFIGLLKENPNNLTAQLDAARTLQMWGIQGKRSKALAEAMSGTEKVRDEKTRRTTNLVWGWIYMVRALRDKPRFVEPYYEALYHLIEARLEYGILENSDRAKQAALKELQNARRRDPNLGTPEWKRRFDELEKRIQQDL